MPKNAVLRINLANILERAGVGNLINIPAFINKHSILEASKEGLCASVTEVAELSRGSYEEECNGEESGDEELVKSHCGLEVENVLD